jgi:hypothetical protein
MRAEKGHEFEFHSFIAHFFCSTPNIMIKKLFPTHKTLLKTHIPLISRQQQE